MRQRWLFALGGASVVAALVVGAVGMSTTVSGFSTRDQLNGSGATTISMDQAQRSVQLFLDRTGNKDLKIDEMMQFDQNFYALVKEKSTGIGAFELLVNNHSGSVSFEPGPNMMWNTKYSIAGHMGVTGGAWMSRWMGGSGTSGPGMGSGTTGPGMGSGTTGPGMRPGTSGAHPSDEGMTVTADRATEITQAWLDRRGSGNTTGTADAFHGYYTFHFEKAGQIAGMLSVNGSSGQVWFHTWHGHFVQVRDLGA